MRHHLLAATAAFACLAQPALAQDDYAETAPSATAADDWTGFYVGGRLGISNDLDQSDDIIEFDTNLDGSFGDTVRTAAGANAFSPGFCGGRAASIARSSVGRDCGRDNAQTEWAVHAGFDYDFGQFVAGVVGEYGRNEFKDRVSAFSTTPANYVIRQQIGDAFALRGRVGFDLDGLLLYGTGGGVYGKIRNRIESTNVANGFSISDGEYELGYRVGGGVEKNVGGFSLGAQYLYTNIGFDPAVVRVSRGSAPATNPFVLVNANGTDFRTSNDEFENHNISVTASFRF